MAQQIPMQQQSYYDPAAVVAQASRVVPGQPVQQTFQQPAQQMPPPASTVQAMQQQVQPQQWQQPQPQIVYQNIPPQGITMTAEDYNKQVEELAENKFKVRAQEVINNAVAAMKGVANTMFNNQQPQQQYMQQPCQQQQSFWNSPSGKVAIGGIGGAIGVGGCKLFSHFFGGSRGGGYTPTGQELNLVGEALKTLFGR